MSLHYFRQHCQQFMAGSYVGNVAVPLFSYSEHFIVGLHEVISCVVVNKHHSMKISFNGFNWQIKIDPCWFDALVIPPYLSIWDSLPGLFFLACLMGTSLMWVRYPEFTQIRDSIPIVHCNGAWIVLLVLCLIHRCHRLYPYSFSNCCKLICSIFRKNLSEHWLINANEFEGSIFLVAYSTYSRLMFLFVINDLISCLV